MNTGSKQSGLPELLTPKELSGVFRMSLPTIYRLVEKRALPFYRVAGSLRFDRIKIQEYLEQSRIEPIKR